MFSKISKDKLDSYSLKLSKKNSPALDFPNIFKTTTFQRIGRDEPPSKTVEERF